MRGSKIAISLALFLVLSPGVALAKTTPQQEYQKRLDKILKKRDGRKLVDLARWCRKKDLFKEEDDCLKLAKRFAPDNSKVKKAVETHERRIAFHSRFQSPWKIEGRDIRVFTNTSEARLHYYLNTFEAFYKRFAKIFSIKKSPRKAWGKKIEIRIYKSREDFDRYKTENGDQLSESAIGYYMPGDKKLILFETEGDFEQTMTVLYHEGTHMLTDLALGDASNEIPMWLSEGLADYFGPSQYNVIENDIKYGLISRMRLPDYRYMLKSGTAPGLSQVLSYGKSSDDFGSEEYAVSWALTHMLIEKTNSSGKPIYRKKFIEYYSTIAKGGSSTGVFRKIFGSIPDMEKELKDYVVKVLPPI